jgi:Protein of unknown function (DUF3987)/Bifunctional DNA primase/polymerase, N-terminal
MTPLEVALSYIARGWNVVPIPFRKKGPLNNEWQKRHIDAEAAPHFFNGAQQNVGVQMGAASGGLTDTDLDCAEARAIAPYFLPKTNAIFGRASSRNSHWEYITDLWTTTDKAVFTFDDPSRKVDARLLELRVGGGGMGAQTVFPGSVHEKGEPIEWEVNGEPAKVDGAELHKIVRQIAAYSLLVRYWPPADSHNRHSVALVVGGFLSRAGFSKERVSYIVEVIARAAGDEEWKDRRKAAEDAAGAERKCGLTRMREVFGETIANKVAEWLEYRGGDGQDQSTGEDADAAWPPPKEIKPALLPVPAFDPELLPPALRHFVLDEAERMPCPPDYIAASLLSVLGSVIGARCLIKPKALDPWSVPPNLWCMTVGEVSSFKTPAMNAAIKPLDRLIAGSKEAHQAAMEKFEHASMVHDAQLKALELELKAAAKGSKAGTEAAAQKIKEHKKAEPKKPAERRFKTNDATIEKLGELLKDSPAGVAVHRDEIVGLLASWEREGHESDRQFYLEAWNGNASHDVDRIGRGSIHIPNLCITILGGIQPDKLRAYQEMTEDRLSNDGVLQRFQLLVYPDAGKWEYRDRPNRQRLQTQRPLSGLMTRRSRSSSNGGRSCTTGSILRITHWCGSTFRNIRN